jgi:hypothetical protein
MIKTTSYNLIQKKKKQQSQNQGVSADLEKPGVWSQIQGPRLVQEIIIKKCI